MSTLQSNKNFEFILFTFELLFQINFKNYLSMKQKLFMVLTILSPYLYAQEVKTFSSEKSSFNVVEEMSVHDQFLDSVFHNGRVFFKSGDITRAFLNYNLIANGIFFLNDDKQVFQLVGLPEIRLISYGKRSFVPINLKEVGEIIATYDNGTSLILQRKSKVKNNAEYRGAYGTSTVTSATVRVNTWNDQGASIGIDKTTEIEISLESQYLLMIDNKITPLKTLKTLKKIYPSKWESIKQFVDANRISLNKQFDVVRLVNFCVE